jgi:hypothetical protein
MLRKHHTNCHKCTENITNAQQVQPTSVLQNVSYVRGVACKTIINARKNRSYLITLQLAGNLNILVVRRHFVSGGQLISRNLWPR